jgi:hypothetical protein
MQERGGQRDAQPLSDARLLPEKVGSEDGLAVTRRQSVESTKRARKCSGPRVPSSELRCETAKNISLHRAEIQQQPVDH